MNAKIELLELLRVSPEGTVLTYADVYFQVNFEDQPSIIYRETEGGFEQFLEKLNKDYDAGYGTQELWGTLWLSDGSWAERSEYDGSENWVIKVRPTVP